MRRLSRAHAGPQVALDIFDDDDRVVDDDAIAKYEAEQRQVVERKAKGGGAP